MRDAVLYLTGFNERAFYGQDYPKADAREDLEVGDTGRPEAAIGLREQVGFRCDKR